VIDTVDDPDRARGTGARRSGDCKRLARPAHRGGEWWRSVCDAAEEAVRDMCRAVDLVDDRTQPAPVEQVHGCVTTGSAWR